MRIWLALAALNGVLSIALGAYGAHGFDRGTQAYEMSLMDKGSHYQMVHALALIGVAWLAEVRPGRVTAAAGVLFVAGIVLFCGALYVTAMTPAYAGAFAPWGGFALMGGWVALGLAGFRGRRAMA